MNIQLLDIVQVMVSGIAMGSVYALMALGFTIIFNALRLINFAQGDMLMLGAAFGLTLFVSYSLPFPGLCAGWRGRGPGRCSH